MRNKEGFLQYTNFRIHSTHHVRGGVCKCGKTLEEVTYTYDDGIYGETSGMAQYCPKCENVYLLKLVKMPDKDVPEEYLKQFREQMK